MASSVPYEPEGFAEANPFAQDQQSPQSPHHDAANVADAVETPATIPEPSSSHNGAESAGVTSTDGAVANPSVEASNGEPVRPVKKYKLTTKVTGLERTGKKDPIIRFDAYTTLPRFRTTTFRDIRRTHNEFVRFFEHLNGANPECFVPSVPAAVTSAGAGTEEDEVKIKRKIQLWLDRVTSNPILARDEEFVYFIESDFGYTPVVKKKPPATGLTRKAIKQLQPPYDEVTELHLFRPVVKDVYLTGTDTISKLNKVSKTRRSLGLALNEFGNKLGLISNVETHQGMINMWRKLGKVIMGLGDLEAVKATSEASSLGDGLEWVINDAYVAKEALTNRHLLMRELLKAQASTKAKHQTAVRVRGSTNINPSKVDEAINALEEATQTEEQLTRKVQRVTENMLIEKNILTSHFEADIKSYLAEYTLRIIDSERRALSSWESVRLDVRAVDSNGGLSRLGRESTPANRRASVAQSQGPRGDSWSGDRRARAVDFGDPNERLGSSDKIEEQDDEIPEDSEETVVDARNAANLLAGSTF